jgi:hypothetical protein
MDWLTVCDKMVKMYVSIHFDPKDRDSATNIANDIRQYDPDILFHANHPVVQFFQQVGFQGYPYQSMVWLLDDPAIMGDEMFHPNELVLVSDPAFIDSAQKRGAKTVIFLPVAATVQDIQYRNNYDFPVVYVGSTQVNHDALNSIPNQFLEYFEQIIRLKCSNPQLSIEELLVSHPYAEGKIIQLSGPLHYFLYTESNRQYRLQFLHSLVESGLRLYGNDEWIEQVQRTKLQSCYMGSIDPVNDYPFLVRSCKININIRSMQRFSAPVHRDFLYPCYGGFTVSSSLQSTETDWPQIDPLNIYRLPDFPWSPSANSPEQMKDLVEHYLKNESERNEWIENSRSIIQNQHTYRHRVCQLGDIVDKLEYSYNS